MNNKVLKVKTFISVGWGTDQRGFGEDPGMKTQILNLIRSIRTVMRSMIIFKNYLSIKKIIKFTVKMYTVYRIKRNIHGNTKVYPDEC